MSSVLKHSCTPSLPTACERCSEWEKKGKSGNVRGVDNRCCRCLGSGEGSRENEGECRSEESHYWVRLWVWVWKEKEGEQQRMWGLWLETNFSRHLKNKQHVSYIGVKMSWHYHYKILL